MTIGERIKNRRKELNMSADTLADILGKNRATIYRYESDEIENLPTSILEPLANALQTTPAYLMGWDVDDEGIEDIHSALSTYKNDLDSGLLTYKKIELTQTDTLEADFRIYRWEELLLSYFRDLNDLGMNEAIKRIEELTHLEKYTIKGEGRMEYPRVISIILDSPGEIPIKIPDEYRGIFRPADNDSIINDDGNVINAAHAEGEPTEEDIKKTDEIMDNDENWD